MTSEIIRVLNEPDENSPIITTNWITALYNSYRYQPQYIQTVLQQSETTPIITRDNINIRIINSLNSLSSGPFTTNEQIQTIRNIIDNFTQTLTI